MAGAEQLSPGSHHVGYSPVFSRKIYEQCKTDRLGRLAAGRWAPRAVTISIVGSGFDGASEDGEALAVKGVPDPLATPVSMHETGFGEDLEVM